MRKSAIALFLLTASVGVGLFLIKYRVQGLELELDNLNRNIARDRELIHVLKAEWSHFNEPNRLRVLAGRHLNMAPIQSKQVFQRGQVEEKILKRPARPSNQLAAKSDRKSNEEPKP